MADKLPGMNNKQLKTNQRRARSVGRAGGAAALTLLLVLAACGQKGPLVLPSEKPAKPAAASPSPPASAPQR